MKAFVSWSGGKDCMLAMHQFTRQEGNEISYLVNMCENNSDRSLSHGTQRHFIKQQAACLGIPIVQQEIGDSYETSLKKIIAKLKLEEGIVAGVFGDIYLQEHRTWIERVCSEMEIEAIFPLWGSNTTLLLNDFIDCGFKALTVSVRSDKLSPDWLGLAINNTFVTDILRQKDIDPCAENGEYHSFVYDGPLFNMPVDFTKGEITTRENHHFLELKQTIL